MNDALDGGPGERRLTREHFVEDAPERVEIAATVEVLLSSRLFRAHVLHGTDGHAGLGQLFSDAALMAFAMPKSATSGVAALEQDVLRLDVAVNDAVGVRVAQGVGDFAGDLECVIDGELLSRGRGGAEGLAVDERHDVEQQSHVVRRGSRLDHAAVEERQNVGVRQAGCGLDFRRKRSAPSAAASFGAEDLDGDLAVVLQILGEVDRGHAALAELALDSVSVGEGLGESVGGGHRDNLRWARLRGDGRWRVSGDRTWRVSVIDAGASSGGSFGSRTGAAESRSQQLDDRGCGVGRVRLRRCRVTEPPEPSPFDAPVTIRSTRQ
jgi:hypothetical protein